MRPEWGRGFNQGYAAGLEDGYEKGYREGRFLGFNDGFATALKETQNGCPKRALSKALLAMNRAGLIRIVVSGSAAQEAAGRLRALGFIVDTGPI